MLIGGMQSTVFLQPPQPPVLTNANQHFPRSFVVILNDHKKALLLSAQQQSLFG